MEFIQNTCLKIDLDSSHSRMRLFVGDSKLAARSMGVWQGVAMDSLKFRPGPPCPTLLSLAGGRPLKVKRLLLLCTPHAVRLWLEGNSSNNFGPEEDQTCIEKKTHPNSNLNQPAVWSKMASFYDELDI
jgi:hypothetical protein